MAGVTIFHNPNCSTSKKALTALQEGGADVDVVQYLKAPPDRQMLESLVARLEDPVADLVRKDPYFKELGLDAADYTEPAAVVDLLLEHPRLMQRPLLVSGDRVFIGRPVDRVDALLS
jgi:arsenate reductase (glutaredoxin)